MPNATNLGSLLVRAVAMEKISWLLLFAIPQVSPQIPSRYLSNMMLELQISICHQLVRLFVQFISSYPNTPMHIIYIKKIFMVCLDQLCQVPDQACDDGCETSLMVLGTSMRPIWNATVGNHWKPFRFWSNHARSNV